MATQRSRSGSGAGWQRTVRPALPHTSGERRAERGDYLITSGASLGHTPANLRSTVYSKSPKSYQSTADKYGSRIAVPGGALETGQRGGEYLRSVVQG